MESNQLIYIRTDGNKNIASGHLVRCLSIALACRQLSMNVHFLVSDEESASVLGGMMDFEASFPISQLKTASYDHLEQELPEVIRILSSQSDHDPEDGTGNAPAAFYDTRVIKLAPIFLLDSYFVTETYLSVLKSHAKIAYLDDLRLFDYPVDLLVNYDIIPEPEMPSYQASYQNAKKLLLGAAYTPLRGQFQGKQIYIKDHVRNILITTGGSDPCHFCPAFIRQLKQLNFPDAFASSDIVFHIVIGKLNTNKDMLYKDADGLPFLQLHENVADMAALMLGCDLAVSAAGTTLYELCALGIPSVSFTMADNQKASARAFADTGAVPCAGDLCKAPSKVLQAVIQFIIDSCTGNSFARRKSAQESMRGLVDGNGALRIARALKLL